MDLLFAWMVDNDLRLAKAVEKFNENADEISLVPLDVVLPNLGGRDVMIPYGII